MIYKTVTDGWGNVVKDCTFCKNLLKYTKKKMLHYQIEEMII